MPYSIQISKPENNQVMWEKQFTDEEYAQKKALFESRETVSTFKSGLVPVRTNTFKNFIEDFFYPALIHGVIKVQNKVESIFEIIAALCFDTFTFPIRIITFIPRILYNANLPEHPLRIYLRSQGVDEKFLERDFVRMHMVSDTQTGVRTEGGVKMEKSHGVRRENINFIEMPPHSYDSTNSSSSYSCIIPSIQGQA